METDIYLFISTVEALKQWEKSATTNNIVDTLQPLRHI